MDNDNVQWQWTMDNDNGHWQCTMDIDNGNENGQCSWTIKIDNEIGQ